MSGITLGCRDRKGNAPRRLLFRSTGSLELKAPSMLSDEEEEIEMQLTNTQVGEESDGMMTVKFQGEGDELVSVRIVASDMNDHAAIVRAKAMMVQLTTFDEDRDTAEDQWSRSSPDDEIEERTEGLSETDPKLPVVSPFGDAPSSSA
jgi:hypothetical protein